MKKVFTNSTIGGIIFTSDERNETQKGDDMSTRSVIAMTNQDGTVQAIYCHSDGYVAHNGRILQENYSDRNKVQDLMDLGDLSGLDKDIDSCVAYHRDRGEPVDFTQARTYNNYLELFFSEFEDSDREYVYVCLKTGDWAVVEYKTAFTKGPRALCDAVAELNRKEIRAVS